MDCACIYVDANFDGQVNILTEKTRKAKKLHKCGECRRDILPGEHYEYIAGIWEGALTVHKTCPECVSIRNTFFCDGWIYEEVINDLYQHIMDADGAVSSEAMENLTPKAREHVIDMIDEIIRDKIEEEE
jgi:hypothetical protein